MAKRAPRALLPASGLLPSACYGERGETLACCWQCLNAKAGRTAPASEERCRGGVCDRGQVAHPVAEPRRNVFMASAAELDHHAPTGGRVAELSDRI